MTSVRRLSWLSSPSSVCLAIAGILVVSTLAGRPAAAQAAAPPSKITTVEGITEYQLDNGLHVITR